MIKKCLFPVAGYGTRFLPATKAMPKEMLPIVNKPLVQYGVEEALDAGLFEIAFVTGRGKRTINDHFDTSYELEHQIAGSDKEQYLHGIRSVIERAVFSTTRQREMKGLGHAILTGQTLIGDEPFGVILADDLCFNPGGDSVMAQMVKIFRQVRCSIVAVQEVPADQIHKFGVIAGEQVRDDLYRVTNMVEKPAADEAPSNLAIIGRYVLTPEIFTSIESVEPGRGGEIQLTDGLKHLLRSRPVYGYKFEGKRYDAGDKLGFLQATVEFALKRYDLGAQFRQYLKNLPL